MNKGNILVVIPSYNSKYGIVKTILGVLKEVPEALIFVVDDSSPDGTPFLIRKKFGDNPRVKLLLRREKAGRGSAVIDGFKKGLLDKEVKYLVEMDADFSHDPKELPGLIAKCKKYDVVVGSRYITGSKIVGWGSRRRIFSKLANIWARLVLGIPITDYTNGYRCYNRKAVEALNSSMIKSKGFAVLSEVAYILYEKDFSFGEVPSVFTYRASYGSSRNFGEVKEAFFTVLKIKLDYIRS